MEMEFILFRLIQLMKRELLILNEIHTLFINPQKVRMERYCEQGQRRKFNPGELILEIQRLELDKKEECLAIAKKLDLPLIDWSLCQLLKEFNQVMDHKNYLMVSLYNDLLDLLNATKCKNFSLQKYLHNRSLNSPAQKPTVLANKNDDNRPVPSSDMPSPIRVKKLVRINMN